MKKKELITKFLLFFLLVISFGLMLFSSLSDSQTTDEGIHLYSGVTYITKGDFRLDPEHPPLLKEIGALPLVFFKDLKVPLNGLWDKAGNYYYDSWLEARILGEEFLYRVGNNPDILLFWGRFSFIILTLILGYFVYFWASKLYGKKAGLLAGFLTLLSPNILAHGRLINTDLGLALFILVSVYFWGKFLKKSSWLNLILAGVFLGFALASKYTALIILPIFIILGLIKFFIDKKYSVITFLKYTGNFVLVLVISFIIIWASYGFSINIPPQSSTSMTENFQAWTNLDAPESIDKVFVKFRTILFPAEYYKGLFFVARHALAGHGSFLLGENSVSGWWYYFPVAFFYKNPFSLFIFLGLAIVFFKKLRTKNLFDEALLIVPPVVFMAVSMFSKADLGIRHILPIFPFVFIYASKSINLIDFSKLKSKIFKEKLPAIIFIVLILWYLWGAVSSFPNYLAYFNELASGPKGGYKVLTDSNLDWGQDIYRLKNYLDENKISQIYIVYPWDGDAALEYYGIKFINLSSEDTSVKGKVVISATYLQTEAYGWLKEYPFEQITPGLFIVHMD